MNNTNVRVELRIMGNNFDVEEITKALNVIPLNTWNIGDPIRDRKDFLRKYTAWIYSTGTEETLYIETQLNKFKDVFISHTDTLIELKKKYDLCFSIDVIIIIENGDTPSIYFDREIINFAAKIDACFDVDTYIN